VPLKDKGEMFRKIPSVDRLLSSPELTKISSKFPRNLILRAINQFLGEVREDIQKNDVIESLGELKIRQISKKIVDRLQLLSLPSLKPVINTTGVIVHTNLGRSILADRVIKRFRPLSEGYSNLEYDLENGKRGSRYSHV
jgi:L-seryl-tRNA(Ser) seleniumtransferase